MNLRGMDLNLLVLLHALLEERHVSRAAQRVGLTQPAMSNALDRCRDLWSDPLLEREGGVMRLTPRGEQLKAPLAAILRDVNGLVELAPPSLAKMERTIGIVLADVLAAVLVSPLLEAVAGEAPGLKLAFHAWGGGAAALDLVRKGAADIAVSYLPPASASEFDQQAVLDEHYLLAGRAGHPALAAPSVQQWLAYPHIVVSAEGATRTPLDDRLSAAGLTRWVALAVPSFLLVPDLLRGSDMLALLPSLSLAAANAHGLETRPLPMPVDGFRLDMARHHRTDGDVAVEFVAAAIYATLRELRS